MQDDEQLSKYGRLVMDTELRRSGHQEMIERLAQECYAEVVQRPGEMTPEEEEAIRQRFMLRVAEEPSLVDAVVGARITAVLGEMIVSGEFEYDPETDSIHRPPRPDAP